MRKSIAKDGRIARVLMMVGVVAVAGCGALDGSPVQGIEALEPVSATTSSSVESSGRSAASLDEAAARAAAIHVRQAEAAPTYFLAKAAHGFDARNAAHGLFIHYANDEI